MTATTKVPLGGTTSNRKWFLDVDTAVSGGPTWTGVFGIQEIKRIQAETKQDTSDMDNNGWKSEEVFALAHGVEGKVRRGVQANTPTAYDPGQEKIRTTALKTGLPNRLHYRIYEMEPGGPRVEAYEGYASAVWNPDGGGMDASDTVSFKLLGQGELIAIDHPDAPGEG